MRILLAAAVAALLPAGGHAQGRACAPHELIVERLASMFGEARIGMGLAADNAVLEIFASAETGTWTIVVTRPGQGSCLVASGMSWEVLAEPLPPAGQEH